MGDIIQHIDFERSQFEDAYMVKSKLDVFYDDDKNISIGQMNGAEWKYNNVVVTIESLKSIIREMEKKT